MDLPRARCTQTPVQRRARGVGAVTRPAYWHSCRPCKGSAWRATLIALISLLAAAAPVRAEPGPVIVAFGDSLTAGYGLAPELGFAVRLEAWLNAAGVTARVVNAGVSGDTTAGGRARLSWVMADRPDLVIVEFGGNDALRGVDPAATRANLDAILGAPRRSRRQDAARRHAGAGEPG